MDFIKNLSLPDFKNIDLSDIKTSIVDYITENKRNAIIIAGLVILIIGCLIGIMGGPRSLEITNYVRVSFQGNNSQGSATITFDNVAFQKDLAKSLHINISNATEEDIQKMNVVVSATSGCGLDKTQGLSNGDIVTFVGSIDQASIDAAGINVIITASPVQYTVSGLIETPILSADTLFADENVQVVFTGASPDIKATVTNVSEDEYIKNYVEYKVSPTYGLSDNDTVTVTAVCDESRASDFGMAITTENTREYSVTGEGSYITDAETLTSEDISKLRGAAEDYIKNCCENGEEWTLNCGANIIPSSSYQWTYKSYVSKSMYLLTRIRADGNEPYSKVYVCIEQTLERTEKGIPTETTTYCFVCIDNIYRDSAGDIVLDNSSISSADVGTSGGVQKYISEYAAYTGAMSLISDIYSVNEVMQ
ncbi:hypothetical protein [Butyrivibrio fibrisolvens]|uniref:hypothetical protein n=1 Tax=Butyrivibrio fibrisolvens TaxID=831 RepID=UPI000418EEE1|nr:hypothetical protein [Butyrivibrio fibrisolvens]